MTKNIFLIQPGEKSSFYRMPLSLLAVGSALDKEGYNVKIVDMRFDDYKKYNYKNAIFVGVTVLTGPTIKHSLEFSRFIKENYPDVPVVWGGIHPSLLPNQTIKNKYIDIVVRGEGEITAVELARSLEKNKSLKGIRGLTYKRMGKIINNPELPFLNMDSLPKINYNLYPLDKATTALGDFPYNSSRGCPSRCKFCYNLNYNN